MKIKAVAAHNGQAHHAKNHHECPMPALRKANQSSRVARKPFDTSKNESGKEERQARRLAKGTQAGQED